MDKLTRLTKEVDKRLKRLSQDQILKKEIAYNGRKIRVYETEGEFEYSIDMKFYPVGSRGSVDEAIAAAKKRIDMKQLSAGGVKKAFDEYMGWLENASSVPSHAQEKNKLDEMCKKHGLDPKEKEQLALKIDKEFT